MTSWEEIDKKRRGWADRSKTKLIKKEYKIPEGFDFFDQMLFVQERKYERGDKTSILHALQFYLIKEFSNPHKPMPRWLVLALNRALAERTLHHIDTWDEVFGPPLVNKKGGALRGKHRLAARHKLAVQNSVIRRVEQLAERERENDKALFEKIGKEFGMSGTDAADIYYKYRQVSIIMAKFFKEVKIEPPIPLPEFWPPFSGIHHI